MTEAVHNLLDSFRRRSQQQAITIDLLREAIDHHARAELGMDAQTPFPELTVPAQNALSALKDMFRYEVAARLLETGSSAQMKVASALLAEITTPRGLSPASGKDRRQPGGFLPA